MLKFFILFLVIQNAIFIVVYAHIDQDFYLIIK